MARSPRPIGPIHYVVTWVILVILGVLSLVLAEVSLGEPWAMVVALCIAVVKAVLVGLVFMHLLEHRGSVRLAAVSGVSFVVLLVVLSALDVWVRPWGLPY